MIKVGEIKASFKLTVFLTSKNLKVTLIFLFMAEISSRLGKKYFRELVISKKSFEKLSENGVALF